MRVSKSRNVCGFVKASYRHAKLAAQLREREQRLEPLRRKVLAAAADKATRGRRLTGGQLGEAQRILAGLAEAPAHAGQFNGYVS